MKLYKFYYKANQDDICHDIKSKHKKSRDDYIKDKYPLYAFTASKKLYKEFKNERNMDNFIILKTDVDKEDYVDYAESHRDAMIDKAYLPVKDDDGKVHDVAFAITSYEQIVIDDMDVEYLFGGPDSFVPYQIFNKDIIKALKVLEYPFFYKIITGKSIGGNGDDYDEVEVRNNDFEILYTQFSGTFRWIKLFSLVHYY